MLANIVPLSVTAQPPNVLFLLVDDMGYNDVSYHNGGDPRTAGWTTTPAIDKLASRGVRLERYYTNPICSPSRATIMSGRYTIRTGIQHGCYSVKQATGLPLAETTLPQALKAASAAGGFAGYETWGLGKWHL